MKDEFPKTRVFCRSIRNIGSLIFSTIDHDTSRYEDRSKERCLESLKECEREIDDLEGRYNCVEWSPENWPPMIRELIDSVECRAQLQEVYDVWIEMIIVVKVYDEETFLPLMEGRKHGNPIDELGISLLRRILRMMGLLYCLVQELKIEYNLYDKEDYSEDPAFRPFYKLYGYPNSPIDQERLKIAQSNWAQQEDDTNTPSTDDDEPSLWCLENKESYTRFSLRNVNYIKLHKLLTDENLGIVNTAITKDYIIDVVQRAQFGRIYQHCDTKRAKFRMVVTLLANRTDDKDTKKEYLCRAARNMGIDVKDVGKYNVKDKSFIKKLNEIL